MTITNITTLRGLGRYSYRMGGMVQHAIKHAESVLVRTLTADERKHVANGWAAERAELASE